MSKLAFALRALALLGMLAASTVHAQAPATPPPLTLDRPALARPKHPKQITANISAGATLNGGNTKSYAATVGGRFQLVRQPHQFMIEALGTFTASRAADDNQIHPTAGNLIGRARYDFFLTDNDALFVAMAPRIDPFAGLDLRLQNQLGYLRNLYNPVDNHRLWMEVGYDFTYDNLSNFTPYGAPPIEGPAGIDKVHSGRAFLGYTNLMTALATLNLGIEYLYDFADSANSRVNATGEFTTSISTRFKLSLLSRILFDHKPVDNTKVKTDYISTVQLVFTYDSIKPPPTCPACDCAKEVADAKSACGTDSTVSPSDLNPPPSAYIPAEEAVAPPVTPLQPAAAQPAPAKPTP